MPIGMEMFNAADEEQWELIKRTIDSSDYYIVIVGERYGSINKDGISYTEMEYNYAIEKEIPILTFVKKRDRLTNPNETLESQYKLEQFTNRVKNRASMFWENKSEWAVNVSTSLVGIIKRKPRIGWVRTDAFEDYADRFFELSNDYDALIRSIPIIGKNKFDTAYSFAKDKETEKIK